MTKHSLEFEIAWQGLRMGEHILDFSLNKDFILQKGELPDGVDDINAQVHVKFVKHESFFELFFDIDGHCSTICDRCGDNLDLQLWDNFNMIVKLDNSLLDNKIEDDADIVFIPHSETVLDISNWIYEYIILSIPIQKVHQVDANGNSTCNPELLKLIDKYTEDNHDTSKEIWKDLLKINIKKQK